MKPNRLQCDALALFILVPLGALAQSPMPTEFPADATPASAEALRSKIAGKVFRVKPADGNTWRLEYKANGYAFIDTGTGFRDTGKWRVEDSKLCTDWQKASSGCSEARLKDDAVYIKRASNGEVITLAGS